MDDRTTKEPWDDLVKCRVELLERLAELTGSVDVVKLAQVRDAIDQLIMERIQYSAKKKPRRRPSVSSASDNSGKP